MPADDVEPIERGAAGVARARRAGASCSPPTRRSRAGDAGEAVILVRPETTPDDVLGMQASQGILTTRGGMVSHAAVVARGWGIPAVVGAADVDIDGDTRARSATHDARTPATRSRSTAARARSTPGVLDTSGSTPPPELDTLLAWADTVAAGHVQVRANADTEGDASQGRILGAQGIGLCRTEHMFLAARPAADHAPVHPGRTTPRPRRPRSPSSRRPRPHDFETAARGDGRAAGHGAPARPAAARVPARPRRADRARRPRRARPPSERVELVAVRRLHEANPMIGTRGVRLGVVRTGVYEMQVRALCTAAANLFARGKRPARRDHDPARRRGRGAAHRPRRGCATCSTRSATPSSSRR